MRTTIFIRILAATLLPLAVIFSLVIVTINNVTYLNIANFAKDRAALVTSQAARQISENINMMSALLDMAARGLSKIDYRRPGAAASADDILSNLLAADPVYYCAWIAYEPGLFPDGRIHSRSMLQEGGEGRAMDNRLPELLADPEKSPWYHMPLAAGRPYLDLTNLHDFGQGEGEILTGSMSYPIFFEGRPVGCIGLDIRYDDIFESARLLTGIPDGQRKVLLLSSGGMILQSDDPRDVGRKIQNGPFKGYERVLDLLRARNTILEEMHSSLFNKKSLICFYPVPITEGRNNLYIYMDIPLDELYAAARSSIQIIISTSALGLILLAFSVFCATRNIVRPIKALTTVFNQAAHWDGGTAGVDPGSAGGGKVVELEILRSALDKMLVQIGQTHELELKSTEARLEKERLLASVEAKNRFFANMSHEIRTPMNAILGISEILLNDGHLTERQSRYINDIKISSDALLTIINDILDLSKLESGNMALSPASFNFRSFLDNISSMGMYLASEKGLAFHYETKGEPPEHLYGDDVRLRQILLNLLSNAVKFTSEGSVTLTVAAEDEDLRFSVADTGQGVKPEDQPFLFQPFKQLDSANNRAIKGTGLGLSISRSLVELMGGRIFLSSEYGRGSVFAFTIPKTLGDGNATRSADSNIAMRYYESARVLVVDDNEINLNVAAGLLKTLHGLDCDTALSGREALEKVQSARYHLIFMDHMMPDMDGVETTERIRALGGQYETLPIVALTANALVGTREMLIAAGMNDFLPKPIRKNELAAMLYKWLPEDLRRPDAASGVQGDGTGEPGQTGGGGFLAKVAVIDEINPAVGLEAVSGQESVYEHSLKLLSDKIPKLIQLFGDLLKAGDLAALTIHIHGLKSSLASVGATALSGLALTLEKTASRGDIQGCRDLLPSFIRQLQALGAKLSELFSVTAAGTAKAAGDESFLELSLRRLHQALTRYDYEAISNSLQVLLVLDYGPAVNSAVSIIGEHVDVFDYDAARGILRSSFPDIKFDAGA